MTTGTYSGAYTDIKLTNTNATITSTGNVSGGNVAGAVYNKTQFETLTNLGTIIDTADPGVAFTDSGNIKNGSSIDTSASIYGDNIGIKLGTTATGTVTNYGTITTSTNPGTASTSNLLAGLDVLGGAVVNNIGTAALISGYDGIDTSTIKKTAGAVSITNAGTIDGFGAAGEGIYEGAAGVAGSQITNEATGVILAAGGEGIDIAETNGVTITNLGTIESTGTSEGGGAYPGGVYVNGNGMIINGSATNHTALIEGYSYGVGNYTGGAITIENFGTISAVGTGSFYGYAVQFYESTTDADRLIFEPGATFYGVSGVYGGGPKSVLELASASSPGTIYGLYDYYSNFGTIQVDAGAQWDLTGDNTVSSFFFGTYTYNAKTSIGMEVYFTSPETLVNNGTLTVEAGAQLDFILSSYDTLSGATAGTLTGSGTIDVYGGTLDIGISIASAHLGFTGSEGIIELTQGGNYSGITLSAEVGVTDTLVLGSQTYAAGDYAVYISGGTIELKNSGGGVLDTLHVTGGFSAGVVGQVVNYGGDAAIVVCFMPGTMIQTPSGEVPVEEIKQGDLVTTVEGTAAPVRWLGRQTVSTKFGDPLRVLPIRIKAGAIAENVPSRDLLCSADHAFLIDNWLIQAGALVNGVTITRERNVPEIFTLYHVECDGHELILADNVPAETFIDNVDRLAFDNWSEHQALYPEGKPVTEMVHPRIQSARQVPNAVLARLAHRAGIRNVA